MSGAARGRTRPVRRPGEQTPFVDPVGFTALAAGPLVAAGVLGWLGARGHNPWLLLLACAAGGPLLAGWFLRPRLADLDVRLDVPERAGAGERVVHAVAVSNGGRRVTPAATVRHDLPGYDPVQVAVPALAPGDRVVGTVVRTARHRGVATHQDVRIVTTAPLGLVRRERNVRTPAQAVVHPPRVPAMPAHRETGDGEHASDAAARSGVDVHAVREWRPGDDARQVHWRATARHGRLVVVEPEQESTPWLVMVVAGGAATVGWEGVLAAAAWRAVESVRAGARVLLVGTTATVCAHPVEVLDWFAAVTDAAPGPAVVREALTRAAAGAGPWQVPLVEVVTGDARAERDVRALVAAQLAASGIGRPR